jgi:hypothetical protein
MNAALLIDSIVRQTTVLIAQLATAAGARAPLAHTANQVFLDLVAELKAQGLGQKVIADMFGLALRTYHGKVRRLSEGRTVRGRSLWSAVLQYVQEQGSVTRRALLTRFHYDDEVSVKGVLNDLVDTGLVYRSGRGEQTKYRAADLESSGGEPELDDERIGKLVWVAVHRFGPASLEELQKVVPESSDVLQAALDQLIAEGKAIREESAGAVRYRSERFLIPLGDSVGWEAAVFDHYQALVTALCAKLALGQTSAASEDHIGGSTYHFDVWEGHPLYDEVAGQLSKLREACVALREKVEAYNATQPLPHDEQLHKFTAYVGQAVRRPEGELDDF